MHITCHWLQELASHLGQLHEMLEGSAASQVQMLTPFGMLSPPLGQPRLKAVHVVAALIFTGLPQADQSAFYTLLSKQSNCQSAP